MKKYTLKKLSKDKFQKIPCSPGVYWYEIDKPREKKKVLFKDNNPAGHFRGKDPTVSSAVLEGNWVPEATILYIGQTRNLHNRIKLRAKFANGEPARAWGGRYLWQLDDSIQKRIKVRYKIVQDYKKEERIEISKFRGKYGKLPFANLR